MQAIVAIYRFHCLDSTRASALFHLLLSNAFQGHSLYASSQIICNLCHSYNLNEDGQCYALDIQVPSGTEHIQNPRYC